MKQLVYLHILHFTLPLIIISPLFIPSLLILPNSSSSLSLPLLLPASDLVDCLIRMREASSRQEAVKVGLLLVSTDYIHHVVDEHHFEDGYLFFRFRQDGQLTNEATTYII